MEKEILEKIAASMDKITLQFLRDNEIIIKDENERKILKYQLEKELKNWQKNNLCIFYGCNKHSIPRSHTIQKSASLKVISENGHTIHPTFQPDREELSAELIGDNDASTFPGFCETHEKLFADFETKKTLVSPEHFELQIYRTVCREIVQTQTNINRLELRLKQYLEHREKRLGEFIKDELGSDFLKKNKIQFKGAEFKIQDKRNQLFDAKLKDANSFLNYFLKRFYKAISKDIIQKKNSRTFAKVLSLDVMIPVVLAGSGNFHVKENNKYLNINVIINVLPFENSTFVIISGLAKHEKHVKSYFEHFSDPLNLVNMVETWMIHGSDHWFIQPSIWNKIKPRYQKKILEDIFDTSRNIAQLYEVSIFNDIKRQIINLLKSNLDKLTDEQKNVINVEESKLTD